FAFISEGTLQRLVHNTIQEYADLLPQKLLLLRHRASHSTHTGSAASRRRVAKRVPCITLEPLTAFVTPMLFLQVHCCWHKRINGVYCKLDTERLELNALFDNLKMTCTVAAARRS